MIDRPRFGEEINRKIIKYYKELYKIREQGGDERAIQEKINALIKARDEMMEELKRELLEK